MSSAAATLKQQKEDFVSNLSGGPVGEIHAVAFVAPVAVLLWSVLQSRQSFFQRYGLLAFTVDYFLNVVAILLAKTLYSDFPLLLSLLLAVPATLVYVLPPNAVSPKRKPKVPPSADSKNKLDPLPLKPFLTSYRSFMLISTIIAILAVDFRLFPRRFAKVETWGTSLMDLGVGSFVFSAGVVAARPVLKERAEGRSMPWIRRILGSLRHSIPLLVLGIIRLLSVKGLDYAEHVSEYGVHWNFFFTLGLLPPFVAASQAALAFVPSHAALALLISGSYQMLLETTDLKAYILTAPRVDLISMNREGIYSFIGYLAIFLAGQDLGMFVIPRKLNPRSNSSAGVQRNTLIMTLAVWTGVWCGLYALSTNYKYGFALVVSRRLANLPYMLWVAAFNSALVLALCVIDSIFFPAFYNAADPKSEKEAYLTATSRILRAYNRNGLALFLLANLLTGFVNMTMNTLEANPLVTVVILVAYTLAVTSAAVLLDSYNISIRV
ncbi:GPI-anchored wall transfer protein-like protein [Hapsidospora chrysogenum ATCC 11550]|uniref:GPI-anchored wall transfer protein n=1 Tax=Hapsidospora chrysogenum (strain ATCC 11550 / CBS 779.69 / DSM 880 / IAM 14645 / JCM 23072 / IMI 49137) TaxID=857340 RepID=A0A086T3A3_HAPC1|nr:GPI-anchored wall transfer protein-like protein [Hapsidospora chrysogenum ATCC 11550]